jgi:4-amino-4-deoxy-L-arabinose transferase-like glycosyltransferase
MLVKRVFLDLDLSGWRRTVICIFAVALLIRGAFVLALKDGFYFPDSVDYSSAAVSLLVKGEFGENYRRPPIYPLFLAGIYALFGEKIVAVRLVEALLGACLAVVIAIIAKRIAGDQVGALAGLLWSIYPLGVFIAGLVYPTSMATMLLACAMLCIVTKADQELTPGRMVVGGIFFGLAALTVPVALATVVTITFWITYWQRTRRLLLATLFLLGVALPLAPWTVRNFDVYDRFVVVEPRLVENFPPLEPAQKDDHPIESDDRIKAILEKPRAFVTRFTWEFRHFWELSPHRVLMNRPTFREQMHEENPRIVRETVFTTSWTSLVSILSVGPTFLFALIGSAAMWFKKERRGHFSLLCITIMSFAIGYSFFWGKMRYRIPIEPYIIILSAYGLRQIWLVLVGHRRESWRLMAGKPDLSWPE